MAEVEMVFTITMFLVLLVFLGSLYGNYIISGNINPKFSWDPREIISSFIGLTTISTGYKFLSFLIAAITAAVVYILIKLLLDLIPG